jgi:pantoate--beta-alanine ligase
VAAALQAARQALAKAGMVPDYVALVHAHTLEPLAGFARPARLIAAAKLGPVRLLDNVPVG